MQKIISEMPKEIYVRESDVTEQCLTDEKVIAFNSDHKINVLCRVGNELYQWCEIGSDCYWDEPKKSFRDVLRSNSQDFDVYVFENQKEFFKWAYLQFT